MARRSLLDSPPDGSRCPACWQPHESKPHLVSVCDRCFVLLVCLAPGRLLRLVPADMTRLTDATRTIVLRRRSELILAARERWRTLPRPPARPVPAR